MEERLTGNYQSTDQNDDVDSQCSSDSQDIEVASLASSIEEGVKKTCRGKMQVIFESNPFHYIIISLVILDALLVLFEFLLGVGVLGNVDCFSHESIFEQRSLCYFSTKFPNNMCKPPARIALDLLRTLDCRLPYAYNASVCQCGFRKGRSVCVPSNEPRGFNPGLVLHLASLTILSLFTIELLLKIIAFRLKYFRKKLEVVDGMVILFSWTLDLISLLKSEVLQVFGLVILFRLWQILRVVNGFTLVSKARILHQLKERKRHAGAIIHAYHKSIKKRITLKRENSRLVSLLNENGQPRVHKQQ